MLLFAFKNVYLWIENIAVIVLIFTPYSSRPVTFFFLCGAMEVGPGAEVVCPTCGKFVIGRLGSGFDISRDFRRKMPRNTG